MRSALARSLHTIERNSNNDKTKNRWKKALRLRSGVATKNADLKYYLQHTLKKGNNNKNN